MAKIKIKRCPINGAHSSEIPPIILHSKEHDLMCIYCPCCGRAQAGHPDDCIRRWNSETTSWNPCVTEMLIDYEENSSEITATKIPHDNHWAKEKMGPCPMCNEDPKIIYETSFMEPHKIHMYAKCPNCGLTAGSFMADLTRATEIYEGIMAIADTWITLSKSLKAVVAGGVEPGPHTIIKE